MAWGRLRFITEARKASVSHMVAAAIVSPGFLATLLSSFRVVIRAWGWVTSPTGNRRRSVAGTSAAGNRSRSPVMRYILTGVGENNNRWLPRRIVIISII